MSKNSTWRVLKMAIVSLEETSYELERHLDDVENETEKFIIEDAIFQVNELKSNMKSNLAAILQ